MRILYVGRNAKVGGGTTFRLNIARGLIARGHQVWLAAWPGEVLPRYREAGVQYVWTPPAPWGAPFVMRAIRRYGIDLVHASNTTPGDAATWACERTGTPMILSIHGLLHRNDRNHRCLKFARKILTFEEAAVERLQKPWSPVEMEKVILLRRPIEHRPQFPSDERHFRIVYVGRLSQRKGRLALSLLEAFRTFSKDVPEARLSIMGDGSLIGEVRRQASRYNRERGETVAEVLGSVPNPSPIVGEAHVVVGASYAALEAIMQGVAVIGAGFWGYGTIDEENLFDAMKPNFGDSGGDWEMSPGNFLAELQRLHGAWRSGPRERYWRLDRLIEQVHSIEAVAGRIERIYRDVLAAPRPELSPALG